MSDLQDKTLTCRECGAEFVFTASEQNFYREKGFENEPTRCPGCRSKRKKSTLGRISGREFRETFTVNCSECGRETQVPFKPVQGKPVYCRECFQARKAR